MEISRYIAKFLARNKYCSLPGLGVFELKKEHARLSASGDEIQAPAYSLQFSPVGSIDDAFASFIASAENVSISNASNHIREFCTQVREALQANGQYEIEALGKFQLHKEQIQFVQSADFQLASENLSLPPLTERAKRPEALAAKPDYSYPPARRKSRMKGSRWILLIVILGLLIAAGYGISQYFQSSQWNEETPAPAWTEPLQDTNLTTVPLSSDTTGMVVDSLNASAIQPESTVNTDPGTLRVVIQRFTQETAAQSKAKKLNSYGHKASVISKDSSYLLVIDAVWNVQDSTVLVDSLRRFFNPKGNVYIMK